VAAGAISRSRRERGCPSASALQGDAFAHLPWPALDAGRRIPCPEYQIYTAKNERLFLRVGEAAVLEEEWDGGVPTVTFFVRDSPVEVNGRKVALAGEDTLAFRALRLEGEGCEVRWNGAGLLLGMTGALIIDVVPQG
jgi:hypothetical protein